MNAAFIAWLTSDRVYPWVMGGLGLTVTALWRLWAWRTRLAAAVDDPTPGEPDADLMAMAEHPQPTFRRLSDDVKSGASLLAKMPDDAVAWPLEDPEPTARYEPCPHTWPTDDAHPCGDGHWHRCTRIPGGHLDHVCICGAIPDAEPVVLVVDPPVVPRYVDPDSGMTEHELWGPPPGEVEWVTFGNVRVHQQCMDWRRDGRHELIVDGCRPHLVDAASNLPSGGAA